MNHCFADAVVIGLKARRWKVDDESIDKHVKQLGSDYRCLRVPRREEVAYIFRDGSVIIAVGCDYLSFTAEQYRSYLLAIHNLGSIPVPKSSG